MRGIGIALAMALSATAQTPPVAGLIEVRKIWDQAPHNAFTDLVRFNNRWFCVFREAGTHVSADGVVRVITSVDGDEWSSAARIERPGADLRDPKLNVTPHRRLMLVSAAAYPEGSGVHHQTMAWFSSDGKRWDQPVEIGEPNYWLWRVSWREKMAYAIGYSGSSRETMIRLYRSRDGRRFEVWAPNLFDQGQPNETSIVFVPDGTALCLLRRDAGTAQLGVAKPPYKQWKWKDGGLKLGGPHLIQLPDGRLVAAGRSHEGKVHTALCWVDTATGRLREFLALPSGGDTSYPGLVVQEGLLWVSYYSSHEGKTSIYLAKVKIP